MFAITTSFAQDSSSTKKDAPKSGDIYFSPVPVIGANPAFGFIYGAGAATSWYMGNPKTTKLSSSLAGIAFTTKSQTILTLKSTVFTADNDYIFIGDWRYLNSSQPTWGLGTGPQSAKLSSAGHEFDDGSLTEGIDDAQMLKFKFIRFYETALKKISDGLYVGIGLHVDIFSDIEDQLLDLDADTAVVTSYYAYTEFNGFAQDKSTLIGLSLNGMLDTRDNINNPYKGRYAFASIKYNPTFLGSDQNSSSLWLEYRDYFNITPDNHNIIAVWTWGNFTTSGAQPYMSLPAIGWDQYAKSGEPYAQGRFRGHNMMFAAIEYRKHLIDVNFWPHSIGMILYANATTADGGKNGVDLFEYINPGGGVGLRLNLSKKSRTNLGIDYGWGSYGTTGFFLRLNENF